MVVGIQVRAERQLRDAHWRYHEQSLPPGKVPVKTAVQASIGGAFPCSPSQDTAASASRQVRAASPSYAIVPAAMSMEICCTSKVTAVRQLALSSAYPQRTS
jgi:hypothetical protein